MTTGAGSFTWHPVRHGVPHTWRWNRQSSCSARQINLPLQVKQKSSRCLNPSRGALWTSVLIWPPFGKWRMFRLVCGQDEGLRNSACGRTSGRLVYPSQRVEWWSICKYVCSVFGVMEKIRWNHSNCCWGGGNKVWNWHFLESFSPGYINRVEIKTRNAALIHYNAVGWPHQSGCTGRPETSHTLVSGHLCLPLMTHSGWVEIGDCMARSRPGSSSVAVHMPLVTW